MKLTTRKISKTGSREMIYVIEREGVPVGLLTKFKNTRTEDHPWKLFIYAGEFIPGETAAEYVTHSYSKVGGRNDLLVRATAELESRGA